MKEQKSSIIGFGKPSISLLIFSIMHFLITLLVFMGANSGGTGSVEDTYSVAILYLILFSALGMCVGIIFGIRGFVKQNYISKLISAIFLSVAIITIIMLYYIKVRFNVFIELPIGANSNKGILSLVNIFILIEVVILFSLSMIIGFIRISKKPLPEQ